MLAHIYWFVMKPHYEYNRLRRQYAHGQSITVFIQIPTMYLSLDLVSIFGWIP